MVVLSTVVAAVGLMRGDTAIIIGAMVIAPLLGPNMGLALAIEHARAQGLEAEETNTSTAQIYQHQARALVEEIFGGGGDHDDDSD